MKIRKKYTTMKFERKYQRSLSEVYAKRTFEKTFDHDVMNAGFVAFTIKSKFIICEECEQKFISNNKLHKHLKIICINTFHAETSLKLFDALVPDPILIILETANVKKTKYAFKNYQ